MNKNKVNFVKLWAVFDKTLMPQKLSLSYKCALLKEHFDLRCEDVDEFPRFYIVMVIKFHNLKELRSITRIDNNYNCIIDLDEWDEDAAVEDLEESGDCGKYH